MACSQLVWRNRAGLLAALLVVGGCAEADRPRANPPIENDGGTSFPPTDGPGLDVPVDSPKVDDGAAPPSTLDPGGAVTLVVPPARAEALAQLGAALAADAPTTATEFSDRWKPKYATGLGYDPLLAQQVDLLQASNLRLNAAELSQLGRNGFAISARQPFPSFFFGYKAIYADDLPLFISADSILYAVHRSYDAILKEIEESYLAVSLEALLRGMHQALGAGAGSALPPSVRADADLYLTVARRLLYSQRWSSFPRETIVPVAGASTATVDLLVSKATDASGLAEVALFGDPVRAIDFSQFKPRGHYVGDTALEAYFRAMIWLGRTDLRIVAKQRFVRRQFEVSLLLATLLDQERRGLWQKVDGTLRAFVGESDNMTVLDFEKLRVALGATELADVARRTDQELAQAITDGSFGIQRIASQVLFVPPGGANAPLDRAFLFLGQRYILDSEVLSNVVFDRVLPENGDRRMLPDPLDVGFAAMGNTHAAPLLADELPAYKNYPSALHRARKLADGHEAAFWDGSLYHAWLGALRAMSPPADLTALPPGLPAVAKTQAWSRRVLNTQLASWAELRHDTLLYAKQSYTAFPVCEFPDAYVDPYPELWAALARYAARGLDILTNTLKAPTTMRAGAHFAELHTVALRLEDMAKRQLTGQAFTAEQLAWVNEAVTIKEVPNCGAPLQLADGWYVRLFYDREDSKKMDPTIADVHTNPFDSEVLHVGTGTPRLMVMTAETCVGPRAYVGLVSSYYEKVTTGLQRLNDVEWSAELKTFPPDVKWMQDLVSR